MQIRDRIKDFRRVKSSELKPNPKNWRTHPDQQRDALRGVLAEVGFADACIARELPDGSLELVDGHLRVETAPDADVPVLVLDVTESEADKILATLDPLSAMAGSDAELLAELVAGIETNSDSVRQLMEETARSAAELGAQADDGGDNPYTAKVEVPPYEVDGPKPSVTDLYDAAKTETLLAEIESSNIPDDEKRFLRFAAMRHVVINFDLVANYYAHSSASVQQLLENSACVIVDLDKAIENGWARLGELLREQYASERES
jgi:hypothetical protein